MLDPVRLAVTMGDPAGIGPQIIASAADALCGPGRITTVYGDPAIVSAACMQSGTAPPALVPQIHAAREGVLQVLECSQLSPGDVTPGQVSAACGAASFAYVTSAIDAALAGKVDAVVTAPINKQAWHLAGCNYPGHTELFAERTGTRDYAMLFLLEKLAVVHVTTHCSLRKAIDLITARRVARFIRLCHSTLQRMGIAHPRIGVGGLNPHAGEGGLFGTEEQDHIAPAIAACSREGISVQGPFPPDTVFMRGFRGEFDGIVAMLHDHGFVALKSRDFEHGVNVTVGLPVIRTSVGHGTAFDLINAGQKASDVSLRAALEVAATLVSHDRRDRLVR